MPFGGLTVFSVVWNPWTDKAKAMADFGDEEVTSSSSGRMPHRPDANIFSIRDSSIT